MLQHCVNIIFAYILTLSRDNSTEYSQESIKTEITLQKQACHSWMCNALIKALRHMITHQHSPNNACNTQTLDYKWCAQLMLTYNQKRSAPAC